MIRLVHLFYFIPLSLFSQIDIYTSVIPNKIFIGDSVSIIYSFAESQTFEYLFPNLKIDNEDITVNGYLLSPESVIYSAKFWKANNHTFPSLTFGIIEDGQLVDSIKTDEFIVSVLASIADTDQDIHNNKDDLKITLPNIKESIMWTLLLIGSFLCIYYFKKKSYKNKLQHEMPKQALYNESINLLINLPVPETDTPSEIEEFYISISTILRTYLKGIFYFKATEMTTDEILHYLKNNQYDNEILISIKLLMKEADLCKYSLEKYGITKSLADKIRAVELIKSIQKNSSIKFYD